MRMVVSEFYSAQQLGYAEKVLRGSLKVTDTSVYLPTQSCQKQDSPDPQYKNKILPCNPDRPNTSKQFVRRL